jgi:hypothetical protein
MSFYLQFLAVQTPFSIGKDQNQREMFSCNYQAERYDSNTLIETDIAALISTATSPSIVASSKISLGMRPVLPLPTAGQNNGTETDGPWVRIISSGGVASDINRSGVRAERPSVQIIVASLDTALAATVAWKIYRLLDGKRHIKTT